MKKSAVYGKECVICGLPFVTVHSNRLACSKECKRVYKNEHKKEYYRANTDKIKERAKEYWKANTDKFKEYKKEYWKAKKTKKGVCCCCGEVYYKEPKKTPKEENKFCGQSCYLKYSSAIGREVIALNRVPKEIVKTIDILWQLKRTIKQKGESL